MALPRSEFMGWERHFERYPPADLAVQQLLALLCSQLSVIIVGLSGKDSKAKVLQPDELLPWSGSAPADSFESLEDEQTHILSRLAQA